MLAYAKQRIDGFDTKIPVLFPSAVPPFIRKLPTTAPLLDDETFATLLTQLSNSHRLFIPSPISETYSIRRGDIRTGVICPGCGFVGMEKYKAGWRCPFCSRTSRDAHKQAIRDWFLLFGGGMKNKDCREFLQVERQQTAHRLLASMPLKSDGTYRDRIYTMELYLESEKRT